jgi:hypothetical protein
MTADPRDAMRALLLDGDNRIDARSIVIANGVSWRKLEIVGAEALVGRGIYYARRGRKPPGRAASIFSDRRRQFGRASRNVLRRLCADGDDSDSRSVARDQHVALPD